MNEKPPRLFKFDEKTTTFLPSSSSDCIDENLFEFDKIKKRYIPHSDKLIFFEFDVINRRFYPVRRNNLNEDDLFIFDKVQNEFIPFDDDDHNKQKQTQSINQHQNDQSDVHQLNPNQSSEIINLAEYEPINYTFVELDQVQSVQLVDKFSDLRKRNLSIIASKKKRKIIQNDDDEEIENVSTKKKRKTIQQNDEDEDEEIENEATMTIRKKTERGMKLRKQLEDKLMINYKKENLIVFKPIVEDITKNGLPLSKTSIERLNYSVFEYLFMQGIKNEYKACPLGPFFASLITMFDQLYDEEYHGHHKYLNDFLQFFRNKRRSIVRSGKQKEDDEDDTTPLISTAN